MPLPCVGVRRALEQAAEDLRYPLSAPQPVSVLKEDFPYAKNLVRKASELTQQGYTHLRKVRGDGNCFYRATFIGWVEALWQAPKTSAPLLRRWPEASLFGELQTVYEELKPLLEVVGGNPDAAPELLHRLLVDVRYDLCGIALIRLLVASFLEEQALRASDESSALGAAMAVQVAEYGNVENFLAAEVLPLGQEAEGTMLIAAATQLKARVHIAAFDSAPGPLAEHTYPSEDFSSPRGLAIRLLFRPGHYEVLYHKDSRPFLEFDSIPATCSFCREKTKLRHRLVCAHCLCHHCSSEVSSCPLCAEVVPPEFHQAQDTASKGHEKPEAGRDKREMTARQADSRVAESQFAAQESGPVSDLDDLRQDEADASYFEHRGLTLEKQGYMQEARAKYIEAVAAFKAAEQRATNPEHRAALGQRLRAVQVRVRELEVHTSTCSGFSLLKVPQTMPSMPGHEMMSSTPYQRPLVQVERCQRCASTVELYPMSCCKVLYCSSCLRKSLKSALLARVAMRCEGCGQPWEPARVSNFLDRAQAATMPAQSIPAAASGWPQGMDPAGHGPARARQPANYWSAQPSAAVPLAQPRMAPTFARPEECAVCRRPTRELLQPRCCQVLLCMSCYDNHGRNGEHCNVAVPRAPARWV
mmetsp:Transcript_12190/g.22476  ORF Transcript_12190/g.22476 Transcript_12190/m.22476 type:complete len:643 (-) Transcript_12190:15-1943(-)